MKYDWQQRETEREGAVVWNAATFGDTARAFTITGTCSAAGYGLELADCEITCIKQF